MPQERWAGGDFGRTPWQDYLARRLASVVDAYQLWHLARAVPGVGLDPVDAAILRSLPERLDLAAWTTDPPTTQGDPSA